MKRSLKLKPEFRIKFSNTRVFPALAFWGLPTVAFAADFRAGLVHAKFASQSEQRVSKLKPGTLTVLAHTSLDQQLETHFLGRIQNASGSSQSYLFHGTATQEIHSIPADRVALSDALGSAIEASRGKLHVRFEHQLRTFIHPSSTIEEFRASILQDLNSGWPVLTSFSAPEKRVDTAYSIFEHDSPEIVRSSKNLWTPANSRMAASTVRFEDAK